MIWGPLIAIGLLSGQASTGAEERVLAELSKLRASLERQWQRDQSLLKTEWDASDRCYRTEWETFERLLRASSPSEVVDFHPLNWAVSPGGIERLAALAPRPYLLAPARLRPPAKAERPPSSGTDESKRRAEQEGGAAAGTSGEKDDWDLVRRTGNAILRYSRDYGVDAGLVLAIIKAESNFSQEALSSKGAVGIMQVMPTTGASLDLADVWKLEENIRAGVRYLGELQQEFTKLDQVVAAYNAGPGAVRRHGGVPPYDETRRFVERVLRFYQGE